jgi:hypothetical protein
MVAHKRPEVAMAIDVGPSRRSAHWREFFGAPQWDPADLHALIDADAAGAAFFEIETYINGLYVAAERERALRRELGAPAEADPHTRATIKARWLRASSAAARAALGPAQRELNLGLMRWMRRASCLSVVVGAGVTMDAGGPSWPALVRRLLAHVLEHGHEVTELVPSPDSTPEHRIMVRKVLEVQRLPLEDAEHARQIVALIDGGSADTEALMQAAQIALSLRGQHLFADITGMLYEQERKPGPIHQAIAALAQPQHVVDRRGWFPGWDAIISYNFDDLMGEALDAQGLARAAYAMRGDEIAGDPNERARRAGQGSLHQGVWHLHGYTPRRPFLITKVQFVFSTAQYLQHYATRRNGIIDHALKQWLAQPVHHALYVGCSFQDEAMNGLLREATERLPGRDHYALLQWRGSQPFAQSSAHEIAVASASSEVLGVRPVWFDRFDEIPALLQQLA